MVELVEPAIIAIERQDVAVPVAGVRIAFNRGTMRDGHGTGIALATIGGELDVHEGRAAYHDIGNADGRTLVQARAKVWMERSASADEIDDCVRVRVDRRLRDILVPRVVSGKGNEAVQACATPQTHAGAGALGMQWGA